MRSLILSFACFPLLAACGGSPRPGAPINREVIQVQTADAAVHRLEVTRNEDVARRTFYVDVERVWAAVPDAFQALGLTGGGVIPDHPRAYGFAGRMPRRVGDRRPSAYLNCGQGMAGPNANEYDVRLRVTTSVEPTGAATTLVATLVQASASSRGVSGAPVPCTSSGALEKAIAEAVAQHLPPSS